LSETRKPGRPKGALNKATADVKIAAQAYTDRALKTLASIMDNSESDTARVAAANSILDRGHGKPKQSMDVDGSLNLAINEIRRTIADPSPRNPDS
jgi:hypothetical protein